jgi:RNA polymerase sporulation-specific sigma factor
MVRKNSIVQIRRDNMFFIEKLWNITKKFIEKEEGTRVYYIGGSEVLPTPLKSDEEAKTLAKLGTDEASQAKSILIEHNLRLVVYIARKFENTGINVEDLISIGTIGLIKAINTFCVDKNIKLATYASRCIENEILMYLRRNTKIKTEVSIDEPLNIDWEGNELLLSDILGTDVDVTYKNIEDEVDKELLNKAMDRLTNREKMIVELRFGVNTGKDEMTQNQVADLLGISQSYISRLEKKIIGRLKKEISKMV